MIPDIESIIYYCMPPDDGAQGAFNQMAYLTLIQQNPRRFKLIPPSVTMGSALVNDLVLESGTVSRRHALIEIQGQTWQIRDLDSTNGVYLNGVAVSMATLSYGDRISLGEDLLIFHENAEDPMPKTRDEMELLTLQACSDLNRKTGSSGSNADCAANAAYGSDAVYGSSGTGSGGDSAADSETGSSGFFRGLLNSISLSGRLGRSSDRNGSDDSTAMRSVEKCADNEKSTKDGPAIPSCEQQFSEGRSTRMFHSLLDMAKVINTAPDKDRLIAWIAPKAMETLSAARAFVFLTHGDKTPLPLSPLMRKTGSSSRGHGKNSESPADETPPELRIHLRIASDPAEPKPQNHPHIMELAHSSWETGATFIHDPENRSNDDFWTSPVPSIPEGVAGVATVPLKAGDRVLGIVHIEKDAASGAFSDDELSYLKGCCELLTSGLISFLTREILIMKSRTEEELAIGARIQRDLLPRKAPEVKGFDIYGKNIPAKEIGGDYYDFFLLDDDHLVILVCDVSGKGVASGMVATMIRSIVRSHTDICHNPRDMMLKLNKVLVQDVEDGMYATIFFSVLELSTRVLAYSCCGHEPPIISKPGNPLLRRLEAKGMAVGLFDGAQYSVASVKLKLGERLIIFTDGVTDLENEEGEPLENDHFEEFIQEAVGSNPREFFNSTFQMLRAYQARAEQADDITMVVVDVLLPFMKPTYVEEE
ncbi:MAG: hypothetical protein CVV64_18090 [Candidatus Wallbacteria bacterium HGW-Wallbacteria-1]|jgi:hypothetical protein|uniref:FHA domain-containing protein n=1 Tax=Candidatus Wallbacteria bacterium HGW-Wallbacteria-1 TaxID=2013854 RepID=A0A2N1PJT3_9BACT|nr:MAG: hypothetical protein CVV64_18090 [Candidatus Wallbacteria bacterium HGW-Wallbacteria-1]